MSGDLKYDRERGRKRKWGERETLVGISGL